MSKCMNWLLMFRVSGGLAPGYLKIRIVLSSSVTRPIDLAHLLSTLLSNHDSTRNWGMLFLIFWTSCTKRTAYEEQSVHVKENFATFERLSKTYLFIGATTLYDFVMHQCSLHNVRSRLNTRSTLHNTFSACMTRLKSAVCLNYLQTHCSDDGWWI